MGNQREKLKKIDFFLIEFRQRERERKQDRIEF